MDHLLEVPELVSDSLLLYNRLLLKFCEGFFDSCGRVFELFDLIVGVDAGLDKGLAALFGDGRLDILHCRSHLKQLLVVLDLPVSVGFDFLQCCIEGVQSSIGLVCQFANLLVKLTERGVHLGLQLLLQVVKGRLVLISRHTKVDLLLHFFNLEFGGVLELFQLNHGSAKYINSLHEAFHALPHVINRFVELLLQLGSQGDFVIAQNLHDFSGSWWMLLQMHLTQSAFVGVRERKCGEKLAHLCRLWAQVELVANLVKELGVLIHYFDDVI